MAATVTLTAALTACGTTAKTESYPDLNGLEPKTGYSMLCNWNTEDSTTLEDGAGAGILLDVGENKFLTSIGTMTSYSGDAQKMTFEIYKWADSYGKTLKKKPVYTSEVSVYDPGRRIVANVDSTAVTNGRFLCLFKNNGFDISFTTADRCETTEGVSAVKCFNGGTEMEKSFKGYATYSDYSEGVTPEQTEKTKISTEKAHVILILGQSNGTGQTMTHYLKEKILAERYAKFEKGFENVKIFYNVDGGTNGNDEFENVTLGMGATEEKFGPEIGIAESLTQKYPDETFYIIKASWSGAGLTKHFGENCAEYTTSMQVVKKGLKKLEKMGLEPEIFAVCWMQGETDSWYYEDTMAYAEKQQEYFERVSGKFADYMAENGATFIDCGISDVYDWFLGGVVNTQKQICDSKNVNYWYCDTKGLSCMTENNDDIHYDSLDMLELGWIFGNNIAAVYGNK